MRKTYLSVFISPSALQRYVAGSDEQSLSRALGEAEDVVGRDAELLRAGNVGVSAKEINLTR